MPRAESRTVLVTDAEQGSALAVVRSLGRAGFRVVAADPDPGAAAMRSRYAAVARTYPHPADSAAAAAQTLLEIVRSERVDLVVPVTDLVVQTLVAERARFEAVTRVALPDNAMLGIAGDKLATLELARRLGVPVPETRIARTESEARSAARELGWPVVIKPRASRRLAAGVESFQVTYAGSEAELLACVERFEGRTPVLLQRWVPGEGHGVEMLLHEGRPLAAFQHRRLREMPVTGGASAYRASEPLDPSLHEQAVRLLGALGWTGLAMVEFRVGPAGVFLMEINGRIWGSLPLAVAAGVDFPLLLARLLLDGGAAVPPSADTYRTGLRARDLRRDVAWIATVLAGRRHYPALTFPPRRAALRALAGWLDPRSRIDAWAWDDPWPAAVDASHALLRAWRKRGVRSRDGSLAPPVRSATL